MEPMLGHAKGVALHGYAAQARLGLELKACCEIGEFGWRQSILRSFFKATSISIPGITSCVPDF